MQDFKDNILSLLPSEVDYDSTLRLKYVGSILDVDKLPETKFKKIKKDKNGWTFWRYKAGKHNYIIFDVAPKGTLARLRLSSSPYLNYVDTSNVYNFGPRIESNLSKILDSIIKEYPQQDYEEEMDSILRILPFDPERWNGAPDRDFIIMCFACKYFFDDNESRLASYLTTVLCRHIKFISNEDVFNDLPYMCGLLGMRSECIAAIKRTLELGINISPEGWTNTGTVLCDNFHMPEAAIACFIKAIEEKPSLSQANRNIWIAGKGVMDQEIRRKGFVKMREVGEKVISIGDPSYAEHGFFSYLGMAYEGQKMFDKADECYSRALLIEPDCAISKMGKRRLIEETYDEKGLDRTIEWILLQLY